MTTNAALCCFVVIVFATALRAQEPRPATSEAKDADPGSQASKPRTGIELVEGKVVRVESGDTIAVKANGRNVYQVKLQAIDAPDLGQPRYEDSKNSLSKLIRGKDVRVVVHATGPTGVLIGTVYRQGRDISLSMLEKGLAWHYKSFPYQQTASVRKAYSDAQNIASAAGLGIWSDPTPIPPWVFRGESVLSSTGTADPGQGKESSAPQTNERKYILGPRGGCYYLKESGVKVYVQDKKLCGVTTPESKP